MSVKRMKSLNEITALICKFEAEFIQLISDQ